ncbi:beta-ketoacyl-ACP synthase 3 [Streptomyces sp. ODS28]|uniref:beta-ketoacyl-ACP synthase 3 n=1 Tax=Streptomyces sp. ODS28 TaxID=3136688 RepID=UPI0031EA1379
MTENQHPVDPSASVRPDLLVRPELLVRRDLPVRHGLPAPAYSRLAALAAYRPARGVESTELAPRWGVDAQWIERRVGVRRRGVADAEETVSAMAAAAARKALAEGGVPAGRVDAVVVAGCSARSPMPSTAARVAAALGLESPGVFDLNAACAGFCYALGVADGLVRAGTAGCVLVAGAERMSDWVDPGDRDTAPVFADGAGAALVTAAAHPGIHPTVWGSAPELADLITIPDGGTEADTGTEAGTEAGTETGTGAGAEAGGGPDGERWLRMQGRAVYRWALDGLADVARRACERAGLHPHELRGFVPHQANLRMIEAIAAQLGAEHAVLARDIVEAGNTSAASVPMALDALRRRGEVAPGDPVLLLGFGAGLSYAGQVVRVP